MIPVLNLHIDTMRSYYEETEVTGEETGSAGKGAFPALYLPGSGSSRIQSQASGCRALVISHEAPWPPPATFTHLSRVTSWVILGSDTRLLAAHM